MKQKDRTYMPSRDNTVTVTIDGREVEATFDILEIRHEDHLFVTGAVWVEDELPFTEDEFDYWLGDLHEAVDAAV